MVYSSNLKTVGQLLFQKHPKYGDRKEHGGRWNTINGHDWNMAQLRKRHAANRKLQTYRLAITINILAILTLKEIESTWKKITRKLRDNKVVYWWMREVSKYSNRVHYHLIIASDHDPEFLKQLIRSANPQYKHRLQVEDIRSPKNWANYLCKSAMYGGVESFHKSKVVLFAEGLGIDVHGASRDFWINKPKVKTPQQKLQERQERDKLQQVMDSQVMQEAAQVLALQSSDSPLHVLRTYAEQVVKDPSCFQDFVNVAYKSYAEADGFTHKPKTYPPFMFKPYVPPLRPRPSNMKTMPLPKIPFDPAKCESFIMGA